VTPADGVVLFEDLVEGEVYDGAIHSRLVGHEVEALAEGTRVWSDLIFPFVSGPASNFDFTPQFPTFLPPDFPAGPEYDFPTVDIPDLPPFVWPSIDPYEPTGPFPPPPPYEGPDDPPDAPYGPEEPPGFNPPPGADNPCGWTADTWNTKFRLKVTVNAWRLWKTVNEPDVIQPCLSNFCEPSALDCANFAEIDALAEAWGRGLLGYLQGVSVVHQVPSVVAGEGPVCSTIDWASYVGSTDTTVVDFPSSPIGCINPEFPTGTIIPPNRIEVRDIKTQYWVIADITIENYVPLALATNMCRRPYLQLEWENGYKKIIPRNNDSTTEIDGNDLTINNFNLGDLDDLKSKIGWPTYTPCDLVTPNEVFMVCQQPVLIWDCGGAPPPPLRFNT
jgi:hypothetical protein